MWFLIGVDETFGMFFAGCWGSSSKFGPHLNIIKELQIVFILRWLNLWRSSFHSRSGKSIIYELGFKPTRSLGHSTLVIFNSNLSWKGLEQLEASSNNLIKDFSLVCLVHIGKMAMSVNGGIPYVFVFPNPNTSYMYSCLAHFLF
jgi:hypothetical protein